MEWTRGLLSQLVRSREGRSRTGLSAEDEETLKAGLRGEASALERIGRERRLWEAIGGERDGEGYGLLSALVRGGHVRGAEAVGAWMETETDIETDIETETEKETKTETGARRMGMAAAVLGDDEEQRRFLDAAVAAVAGDADADADADAVTNTVPVPDADADTDGDARVRTVEVLVRSGVARRVCGHPPLVQAAVRRGRACLSLLRAVAEKAEPHHLEAIRRADLRRCHLLHHAALLADPAMVAALLRRASPTIAFITDTAGQTPFHAAVRAARGSAVLVLLLAHAPHVPNVTTLLGLSLAHYCAIYKNPEALRLLLDLEEFYPLTFDSQGNSPLHFAAENADAATFEMLVNDPRSAVGLHIPNKENVTPADIALQKMSTFFSLHALHSPPESVSEKRLEIQIASDIHLEFYMNRDMEDFSDLIVPAAPYLALLGDLTVITGKLFVFQKFLDYVSPKFTTVFVIAGNHEYYKSKNFMESQTVFREFCNSFSNVVFMERDECLIENIAILGTTLWSYCPTYAEQDVEGYLNDYRCVFMESETPTRMRVADTNRFHTESVHWLRERIEHHTREKRKILVLTHHSPLINIASSNPMYFYSSTNHGFCTDLRGLMTENVEYWCYGHTHYFQDMQVGHTRVISNPAGYPPVSQAYSASCVVRI